MKNCRIFFLLVLALSGSVFGAENRQEGIGELSSGIINIRLRITEDVRAGLVRRNQPVGGELRSLISSGLVEGLSSDESTTLSLCVLSSGGGMFEVSSYELPGQNSAYTQYGDPVSLQIGFGNEREDTMKLRSSELECDPEAVVPVTIHLEEGAGVEVGRIHGSLKLLVKSE